MKARIFGLAALTLTGIYLYTFPVASIPYFGIELAHILGGLIFALVLILSVRAFRWASLSAKTGWILIAIGAVLGVSLTFTGATRPLTPLLYSHIFASAAGIVFL